MTNLSDNEIGRMVEALSTIASYYNPAISQDDGAQAAARLARETLVAVGLGPGSASGGLDNE